MCLQINLCVHVCVYVSYTDSPQFRMVRLVVFGLSENYVHLLEI
jgi:hypothetical protein